jgi:hypothetical protein
MSEEGPSGHLNQRGRPMVLLPRVNAQNTKSGQEQHRLMGSVVHDVLLIYAVRNVCGLVGCERRTTPEHAASASPSSRSSCIGSRRQIRRGERSGEESAKRDKKSHKHLVSPLVMLLFLSVFFGGHGGHSEVWRDGHF